jgi:hypothetical protein
MIHIVFQQSDIGVLKEAITLDPQLGGEVIQIIDDFAVGPIRNIHTQEGMSIRKDWWRKVLSGGDYDGISDDGRFPDDLESLRLLREKLIADPLETVWIWAAQNAHDVSGYYWLTGQLKDFQGRVFLLYLNNLPFINTKGAIFYPTNLFDIPAREFLKAKKLARQVSGAEFETDPEEWSKLGNEDKGVRILEGAKKLVQYDEDFYDQDLKKFITGDWIKASKLIHQFLAKAQHITGDAYLLWRLKQIIASNQIDVQGQVSKMKEFEVKLQASQPIVDQQP